MVVLSIGLADCVICIQYSLMNSVIFSKSHCLWIKFSGGGWGLGGRAFLDTSLDVDISKTFIYLVVVVLANKCQEQLIIMYLSWQAGEGKCRQNGALSHYKSPSNRIPQTCLPWGGILSLILGISKAKCKAYHLHKCTNSCTNTLQQVEFSLECRADRIALHLEIGFYCILFGMYRARSMWQASTVSPASSCVIFISLSSRDCPIIDKTVLENAMSFPLTEQNFELRCGWLQRLFVTGCHAQWACLLTMSNWNYHPVQEPEIQN